MPRANRYFLPGHVWHLTHRCHRRGFLLKFVRDRRRWVMWLFEARKRYGDLKQTVAHLEAESRKAKSRAQALRQIEINMGKRKKNY